MDEKELELFREDGCLTDEGLQALRDGQLDELGGWKRPNTSLTATNAWTATRPC